LIKRSKSSLVSNKNFSKIFSSSTGFGNLSRVVGQIQTVQSMAGRTNFPPTIPFLLLLLNLRNSWNFNQINSWFPYFTSKAQNAIRPRIHL